MRQLLLRAPACNYRLRFGLSLVVLVGTAFAASWAPVEFMEHGERLSLTLRLFASPPLLWLEVMQSSSSQLEATLVLLPVLVMAKPALNLESWTADEKLDLIDDLWTSVDFHAFSLTPEQRAELDRRPELADAEGPVGFSWEQVEWKKY